MNRPNRKNRRISQFEWLRRVRAQLGPVTVFRGECPLGTKEPIPNEDGSIEMVEMGTKRGWFLSAVISDQDVAYWGGFNDWHIFEGTRQDVIQSHYEGLF